MPGIPPMWTEAEDATLAEMIARNVSSRQIAAALNRTRAGVLGRARRIGLEWCDEHRANAPLVGGLLLGMRRAAERKVRAERAVEMFRNGATVEAIAADLGLKLSVIGQYLREGGINRRKPPQERRPRVKKRKAPKPHRSQAELAQVAAARKRERCEAKWRPIAAEIIAELNAGGTIKDAAARRGLKREYVSKRLFADGWRRPKPEPKPLAEKRSPTWLNTAGVPKRVKREQSLYTDAATFLAPHYRPVVRADIVDDPYSAPKGEPREYIVGTHRMPALDMLDVARGLGFPG